LVIRVLGRPCGLEEAKEYPYLYFTTPLITNGTNYNYRTVCVKEAKHFEFNILIVSSG